MGFPLPPTTGFNSIQGNFPATVQNEGFEFELSSVNIDRNLFRWNASINLTVPQNKLIEFPDLDKFPDYQNTYVVGKPLNIRKLYHFENFDESGYYRFTDVDDDGTLNNADRQTVKKVGAEFYGGVQNNFQFHGFQLSFTFQFVKQTGNNYLYSGWPQAPGLFSNQPNYALNRWAKSHENAGVQRFTVDPSSPYRFVRLSDLSVGDASFIRLKNVSVSIPFQKPF